MPREVLIDVPSLRHPDVGQGCALKSFERLHVGPAEAVVVWDLFADHGLEQAVFDEPIGALVLFEDERLAYARLKASDLRQLGQTDLDGQDLLGLGDLGRDDREPSDVGPGDPEYRPQRPLRLTPAGVDPKVLVSLGAAIR